MQKLPMVTALTALFLLSGCVTENKIVANDRQVTQRNVDNTEAARTRISLGLNYLRRGDNTQALFNLERARTMAPNMPEVYNALAFYYQTVGEHVQAENAYKQAIARDRNNADAYNNYGAFLCQIGKFDEAEQLLLRAIAMPGYIRVAESYENLALCQLEQNNFERAKNYLTFSISHNATRLSALINSAALNYAMGNLQDAKADLQRIQRLGRVSARSTLLNYLVSEKQGDVSTQRHAEQLLMTLYIDSPEAKLLLQQRLLDSEFEILRERYKQHLLATFLPVAANASGQLAQPVANPQLRIRRKAPESTANHSAQATVATQGITAPTVTSPLPVSETASAQPERDTTPPPERPTHSTTAIAGSLNAQQIQAITPPAELPVERIVSTSIEPLVSSPEQATQRTPVINQTTTTAAVVQEQTVTGFASNEQTLSGTVPAEAELTLTEKSVVATTNIDNESHRSSVLSYADTMVEAADQVPEHIVVAGDTLHSISVQYNILLNRLQEWNHLQPEARLRVGQKIFLAPNTIAPQTAAPVVRLANVQPVDDYYHLVAEGDTMFAISYRYNIRLERFMAWNNLTEESRLFIGQRLYIVDPATINND